MTLSFIEVMAHATYYVLNGHFLFQSSRLEKFNIRPFTKFVDDNRFVTLKAGFDGLVDESWHLTVDERGFRGDSVYSADGTPSIVFLGDSVPFGWGVLDNQTVPHAVGTILHDNHDPRGVINAAIPSYSLGQAISRYELELSGQYDIDVLFMQIYDPVSQLSILGHKWKPGSNWTNLSTSTKKYKEEPPLFSKYLATTNLIVGKLGLHPAIIREKIVFDTPYSPDDIETTKRFENYIDKQLDKFHQLASKNAVRKIIVAPVTVPKLSRQSMGDGRRKAISVLNTSLQQFAQRHDNVVFFDSISLLDAYADSEVYIDDCCHLSQFGAEVIAAKLAKLF